jgi:glycosyltransferase involved in cell wall biosynthesis
VGGGTPGTKNLTVVIEGFGRGGTQRVVRDLMLWWLAAGRSVHLITLQGSEHDRFVVPAGITRDVIGGVGDSANVFVGLLANVKRVLTLRRMLRRASARTIISFITVTNILTIFASLGLEVRVIVCERGDPRRQSLGFIWRCLRRLAYPRAHLVTANSCGALLALAQFVPGDRLVYVPNPLRGPQSNAVADAVRPSVIAIGRLQPVKAPDVLLRAFSVFHREHPDWRLMFVGSGPMQPQLLALAAKLEIGDAVDWIGDVDDPYPWLRAARIFALASRHEGMPNALLEAMSCGLPCIVTDASPGPLELVTDGKTGLVVPVDDPEALARALDRIAVDRDLGARLGAEARVQVHEFSPSEALLVWDQVLSRASAPS